MNYAPQIEIIMLSSLYYIFLFLPLLDELYLDNKTLRSLMEDVENSSRLSFRQRSIDQLNLTGLLTKTKLTAALKGHAVFLALKDVTNTDLKSFEIFQSILKTKTRDVTKFWYKPGEHNKAGLRLIFKRL